MSDTTEIPLNRGLAAIVDAVDLDRLVAGNKWFAHRGRYTLYAVRHAADRSQESMHRLILRAPRGTPVDHINGNGLDNRRSNLRTVSYSENKLNSRTPCTNTSGFRGVTFHRCTGKWTASVKLRGVRRYLGLFLTPVEAALAYDAAALELFGEFALPNFPAEQRRIAV